MNSEKNFVILTPGFPFSEDDTTCLPMQQQLVTTIKELYPQLKITVLSFQYPYHKKVYLWKNAEVISFDGRNSGGLKKIILRKKIFAVLRKLNKKNNIAGLLSFWCNECALVGKKFSDKYGCKHLCWILGQDAGKENKYPQKISFSANELMALSDFIQNEFEKNHRVRPAFVIPPGIDETLFNNSVKEKNIDILGVGSLIPLKQYEIFIKVIAEIKKQIPYLKALLVGNGPEKEKLQSIIVQEKLQNNIQLTGELPYPEVLQLMHQTKILLHPSSYEAFGMVCLEALYSGAHVISFCKPMNNKIDHWHIVKNKNEMLDEALKILKDPYTEYSRVKPFDIRDTTLAIMKQFGM